MALCAVVAALAPAAASAAPPVIVPPIDAYGAANATSAPCGDPVPQDSWRTCMLPNANAIVDWPDQSTNVWGNRKSFVFSEPGHYATWLGEQRTEIGRPLIWYDVGSGVPPAVPSIGYVFPLAGKYAWECLVCSGVERDKLNGTMYVIGPRPILTWKLVSPDNSGTAITYQFDASGSFVTDFQPYNIVEYAFDFQDDGVYDQTSPEPTGTFTYAPGPHTIKVRVKDDRVPARYAEYPVLLEIPYVRPGNPEPNPIADSGRDKLNPTGVKFSKTKIKLKTLKKIRVTVLNRKGLSVKISGLTKGDRVKAKLLKGKKTIAARSTITATTSKTVRLKVGRKGKRTLKAKPSTKRLVVDVAVEGTDGYTGKARVGVRLG
ncbi:MAG TPA: PKD domain-containing protein [Solirubrobacteraceae bacterium]|nr:PKD domain-containing protein [Solirubrobacteraceae bacterium]